MKIVQTKEVCGECKGPVEVKVDEARKRVVVSCWKCRKRSIISFGKVIADGEPIPLTENP
jgi:hypothetical protein